MFSAFSSARPCSARREKFGFAKLVPARRARHAALLSAAALSLSSFAVVGQAVAPAPARAASSARQDVTSRPDAVSAVLAARVEGHRVEVTGLDSESSQTWANPDGSLTTTTASGPVQVKQKNGSWAPIDLDLQQQSDGSYAPAVAPEAVTFSGGGDASAATLAGPGGSQVGLGWLSKLPTPTVSGGVATYKLNPTTSLQLTATSLGFTAHLVLSAPPASAPSWSLPLSLAKLTASQAADGSISLKDSAGNVVANAHQFSMWDAQTDPQGDPTNTHPVTVTLTGSPGNQHLVLTPDQSWLTDPSTQYPVTIDPDLSNLNPYVDTWVSSANPTSNYNGGTFLKTGSPDGTTKQRAFISFLAGSISGKDVTAATLTLKQHYAATCNSKKTDIYPITAQLANATWNNQPGVNTNYSASLTGNLGGGSGCPSGYETVNVKSIFAAFASGAIPNYHYGLELRADNETDSNGEKDFCSSNIDPTTSCNIVKSEPSLSVTYNSYPNVTQPVNPRPGGGSSTGQLSTVVSDPDGGKVTGDFFVQDVTAGNTWVSNGVLGTQVQSGKTSTFTPPGLIDGHKYQWTSLGYDGTDVSRSNTGWQTFTYDTDPPAAPTVTSDQYSAGAWNARNPTSTFSFSAIDTGGSGVDHYLYGLDTPTPESSTDPGKPTASMSVPGGWHTLYVRAVDAAGNLSPITKFSFGAGAGMVTPTDGGTTQHSVTLSATTAPGATQVTYYYRQSDANDWTPVPTADVAAGGSGLSGWPYSFSAWADNSGSAPDLVWNVASTLNSTAGPVQIAACFGASCPTSSVGSLPSSASPAVNVTFDPNGFYADTQSVGPGTVNLLTGNLGVDTTDVSVPGTDGTDLTVERSSNAFTAGSANGVTGPGWTVTLPVDSADNDYPGLSDTGSVLNLTNPDGSIASFAQTTSGGSTYKPTGQDADSGLVITVGGTGCDTADGYKCYTLSDLNNNATVFQSTAANPAGGSTSNPISYVQISATQPGNSITTTYTESNGRYSEVLAPTPSGATCTNVSAASTWSAGCRALFFAYNGSGLLTAVTYATSDGTGPLQVDVACYAYNANGQLASEWDPRDIQNPNGPTGHPIQCDPNNPIRPTSYTYDSQGRIASIANSGLDTTTFTYASNAANAALTQVTDSAGSSDLITGIVYGVPLADSGDGNRPNMTAATTGTWAQTDDPDGSVGGTAICPPGITAPSSPDGNLQGCTISYVDPQGLQTNTASCSHGWDITTTEYDTLGNVVRTLSADDRAEALNPTGAAGVALGLPTDTATAAEDLSTTDVYTPDALDGQPNLTQTFGPYHQVELANGNIVDARQLTTTSYDDTDSNWKTDGHPTDNNGQPVAQHLPMSTVQAASQSPAPVATNVTDTRETDFAYNNGSDTAGWTFGTPLKTTVVMPGGSNIVTTTKLDPATGNTVATSQPSDTAGTDTGTTLTEYYTAGSNSDGDCANKPQWAGLVCKTLPAAQPTTAGLPGLVTTWYSSYDYLQRPAVAKDIVKDASGATQTRTTTTTYGFNSAANPYSNDTYSTAITGGVGTAVPTVTDSYDPGTGLPTGAAAAATGPNPASATATRYDGFGRVVSYTDNTDATGAQANTTSTSYDPASGQVTQTSDAHTTTTYGYDTAVDGGQLPTSEQVTVNGSTPYTGTWTASYDPDGNLISETDPNAVTTTWTSDETGQQVQETATNSNGPWLTDTAIPSIHGQWLTHDGMSGNQTYSYDADGRLTQADDTPTLDACTTRTYTYDQDSNRTTSGVYPAATNSDTCQTGTLSDGTTTSRSYDNADRLTDPGISYDAYGRITALPAADATGGAMTLNYYADDLAYSETQANTTQCFGLDADRRLANSTTFSDTSCSGTATAATVNHYDSDSSDSPTWIAENTGGSNWTANITDLSGGLAATVDQAGTPTYLYNDLHGNLEATAGSGAAAATIAPDYDEFGNDPTIRGTRYGWLGGMQRSAGDEGGLVIMGVRLYDPTMGRFLQTDSVFGGSANPYDYCGQDPINSTDLGGTERVDDTGAQESPEQGVRDLFRLIFGPNARDKYNALIRKMVRRGRFGVENREDAEKIISRVVNRMTDFRDDGNNVRIEGDGKRLYLNRTKGPGTVYRLDEEGDRSKGRINLGDTEESGGSGDVPCACGEDGELWDDFFGDPLGDL